MKRNMWKSLTLSLLVAALLVVLTGCSSQEASGQSDGGSGTVGMANPVVRYDSLAEAEKAAQFTFTVPEGVNVNGTDYEQYYWSVINKDLIEVRYGGEGSEVCYMRKAVAETGTEDISGDYNVYDDVKTVDIMLEDGRESEVTLKGKDGKFYLALWQLKGAKDNGIWNYAIGIQGVPEDDLLELVKMVE